MLELFSPQKVPPLSKGIGWNKKYATQNRYGSQDAGCGQSNSLQAGEHDQTKSVGDDGSRYAKQVISWKPGEPLPWDILPPPSDRIKCPARWKHTVYLGVYDLDETYKLLHQLIGEEDGYGARPTGKSACAGLVIDQEGRYVKDSALLSSALWSISRIFGSSSGSVKDMSWAKKFPNDVLCFKRYVNDFTSERNAETGLAERLPCGEETLLQILEEAYEFNRIFLSEQQDACHERKLDARYIKGLEAKEIFIKSQLVYHEPEKNPAEIPDFLNSFFLDDLELIRKKLEDKQHGKALALYLSPSPSSQRVDVILNEKSVDQAVALECLPKGRWPSPPEHSLALRQQFAVNQAMSSSFWELPNFSEEVVSCSESESSYPSFPVANVLVQSVGTLEGRPPSSQIGRDYFAGQLQQRTFFQNEPSFSSTRGIMGVNGPPGTGKTTMLRDLLAGNVVARAERLCGLNSVDQAFSGRSLPEWKVGDHRRTIHPLVTNLTGFEMVLASANNAAVENVSLEIVERSAIGEKWRDEADYFGALATKVLKASRGSTNKSDETSTRRGTSTVQGNALFAGVMASSGLDEDNWDGKESEVAEFDTSQNGAEAWGIVAARLGNKKNRRSFRQAFWFGHDEEVKDPLSGRPIIDPSTNRPIKKHVEGMEEHLKRWWQEGSDIDWQGARYSFSRARERVNNLINEREEARARILRLKEIRIKQCELRSLLPFLQAKKEKIAVSLRKQDTQVEYCEVAFMKKREEYEQCRAAKPGILAFLFTLGQAKRQWETVMQSCEIEMQKAGLLCDRVAGEAKLLRAQLHEADRDLVTGREDLDQCDAEEKQLIWAITDDCKRFKDAHPEAHRGSLNDEKQQGLNIEYYSDIESRQDFENFQGCSEENGEKQGGSRSYLKSEDKIKIDRELYIPWLDEVLEEARSKLFFEALKLHEAFLANSAKKMYFNLQAALEIIAGEVREGFPKKEEEVREIVRAAWQIFFFVVPLVSTTFASFGRMFSDLGPEDLGWLVIDEAGQASPQCAARAIWCSQRVIAVGDPLQLEPVAPLPHKIQEDIVKYYGIKEEWIAPEASVQTLVDRISQFGTEIRRKNGNVWVGAPLTVHRRCDSPMFDICNEIAYGGMMVNQVDRGPEELDLFNVSRRKGIFPSAWLHVAEESTNTDSHLQKGQIERLERAIESLYNQGVPYSHMVAISPFRDVAEGMRNLAKRYKGLRAGTVHTAQGREADVVFFVLGGNPSKPAAKKWASEKVNLVNVAVSRAKRRFYVIGDRHSWGKYPYFNDLVKALSPSSS